MRKKRKKNNTLVQANCSLLYSIYVITIHLLPFSNLCFFQRSKNCSGFSWQLIKHIFRISPFVADAKAFHFDAKCGLPAAGVRRWGWQQRIAQAWSASEPAAAAGPTGKRGSSGGSVQKGTAGEACGQQPRVGWMFLALFFELFIFLFFIFYQVWLVWRNLEQAVHEAKKSDDSSRR